MKGGRVLGTSHDERIMTAKARARNKAGARCKAMAMCSAKFCELIDTGLGGNLWSPLPCDDDTKSRRFFQDQLVFVHALNCSDRNQVADVSSLICVDPFAFAHESLH